MPWVYSNAGGSGYAWSGLNTYNQHCAKVTLPANGAVTQLYIVAAGYNTGSVTARIGIWNVGGSNLAYTNSFTMADGNESTQYEYTEDLPTPEVLSSGNYWVGIYRKAQESHIMQTTTGSGDGYRKTNTAGWPSIASMSGYNTDSNDEPTVGLFYITAPTAVTGATVSRNSDTSQSIEWTRTASSDDPYYKQMIERYDNVSGSYSLRKTITGTYSTAGTSSWTDTTTIANRIYRYRIRAWNNAGYSSYAYTGYINTTPAAPTNVVATRIGGNVEITWEDNSTNEDQFRVQRNESIDNGASWLGWYTLDTPAANSESATDLSPYTYGKYRVRAEENDDSLDSAYLESNDVVTIAQPDEPTGLSPNSAAFDGDEDKNFSWNHNPTDNTDQTKFSLIYTKSGGTYPKEIDNFLNHTDWTCADTLASDTTNCVLPSAVKMSDSDDTGSTVSMYKSVSSMDLTEFDDASSSTTSDLIVLLCYISDVSLFSDLTIKLGDDNTDHYYYSIDPSASLEDGWNQIAVAKSGFSTAGSPSGWDDITYLRVDMTTENNASSDYITSQYLMLAKVTDFTSYAGTKYVQYNEIEITDEEIDIVADTFQNGYDMEWKVKTWGEHATGSDWSDAATFSTVSRPVPTISDPTAVSDYNYSELTVTWTYTQAESYDQVQYLCKLYDENDALLETKQVSSNKAHSESDTCTFDYILSNETTYTVILQVQEENGLWSEEEEVEFNTDFLQPTQPTIELTLDEESGSIDVEITNPDVVTEYTEDSTQDTYIDSDNSSTNYDDAGEMLLEDDTAGGTTVKTILLDFDLSFFVGKTIVSSELILYRKVALTPGIDSTVNYIKTSWDETTVTYGTIPTLDSTDYDDHTHSAGDTETWDVTTLLEDIADESISDYEGMAVVATTTDGSTDSFYDSTISDSEPELYVEIEPLNAETDHNIVYRSINGGDWEIVDDDVPVNTTVTDYIPNIGGNNNYYVEAVSTTPSSNESAESDLDVELTGAFFLNGGSNFSEYSRFVGDVSLSEKINRNETSKQYAGRTYPVKYQGDSKIQEISFSGDLLITNYETLVDIIEYIGDVFYRDWRGRWFLCMVEDCKFDKKDNLAYQFGAKITRLEEE